MPIKQESLIRSARDYSSSLNEGRVAKADTQTRLKTAFLCHSHQDEILVKGLIKQFRDNGIDLYVDWLDQSMPETPDEETAQNIQNRIRAADIFLFLATLNSKNSRWCPWEIGYADGVAKRIYIIPTSDDNANYGNEYLRLYKRIDDAKSEDRSKSGFAVDRKSVV